MREYQPNSHRSKEQKAVEPTVQERKVEKVVSGNVKTRDNKGRKFMGMIISEDAANVKSYVIMDVLVPAFKKLVSDIVTDGIDIILYGGSGGRDNRRRAGERPQYRTTCSDRSYNRREPDSYESNSRFDYEDIVYDYRSDAEAVRKEMLYAINEYGLVSVADMYDMSGKVAPRTSNNYGWMSARAIENTEPKRVRDGYILPLPKATPIE